MSDTATPHDRRTATLQRLDRLEGFLAADPRNGALRVDAFSAALQCGAWDRARSHLDAARTTQPEDAAWSLREGDLLLAQNRYAEARDVLQALSPLAPRYPGLAEVLSYNLAFIDFSEGGTEACMQRLKPLVTPAGGDALAQQLWLRALHRAGQLEEACRWSGEAEQAGRLDAAAAGIAALVAVDEGEFAGAKRWSQLARGTAGAATMELLVAEGSLALASQDARAATRLADEALERNPREGRAWSLRAFAALLTGDLRQAMEDFDHAVQAMPGHIGTWHGRGWAAVLRKDLPAAQASFESALALDRNFGESHGGMAVVLAMQGQQEAAKRHIEISQRLDAGNLSSRYAEALISGDAADAVALQRLAQRLLRGRKAPLGGTMADWLPR